VLAEAFKDGLAGPRCRLVAHEDTHFVELLPFAVEGKQGADFKEAGGDVEGAGNLGPVLEIAKALPFGFAVIDDEQFAAGFYWSSHGKLRVGWRRWLLRD
jgi:hypothetical protein